MLGSAEMGMVINPGHCMAGVRTRHRSMIEVAKCMRRHMADSLGPDLLVAFLLVPSPFCCRWGATAVQ